MSDFYLWDVFDDPDKASPKVYWKVLPPPPFWLESWAIEVKEENLHNLGRDGDCQAAAKHLFPPFTTVATQMLVLMI